MAINIKWYFKYIDNNSEELRKNFVNFKDGKKVITVDRSNININEATKEVWEGVIDEFSSKIKENIKVNILNINHYFMKCVVFHILN